MNDDTPPWFIGLVVVLAFIWFFASCGPDVVIRVKVESTTTTAKP